LYRIPVAVDSAGNTLLPAGMHKITMLGAGLIGRFYTQALHGNRSRDRVEVLYSRHKEAVLAAAGGTGAEAKVAGARQAPADFDREHLLLKRELMPDGRTKLILNNKGSGRIVERIG
jgi:hypothetical protein